jgi:rhodanese-related sulfurtransferase
MKKLKYLLFLLALPALMIRCGNNGQETYGSADELVTKQNNGFKYVSAEKLRELMNEQLPGIRVIDVREPEEFEKGHIPGAVNIPRGVLEFSDRISNRRESILLYCDDQSRSVLSANALKMLKYRRLAILEGGFEKWVGNYPGMIEEGNGDPVAEAPVKKESSGGCGG